ncbi:nitroreductase [Bacteroidia bacterium]|nr:nitroreductase [Bacteroidia bacterium]GHV23521.1 nitroreductase [Bacteroidia bacterium]
MDRNFKEALMNRRSYYAISDKSPVSDKEIEDIVKTAVKYVPSAFNSQSTRIIVLLKDHHKKLWEIVKSSLKKIVPENEFPKTVAKIDGCFAAGYGTVLFFEDQSIIKGLQEQFPLYAGNFPVWSDNTAGMHQLAVWTMLEDAGLGASLQHYHPLIDEEVAKTWHFNKNWKLTAQMPFGTPVQQPEEKQFQPVEERAKVYKF